MDALYNHPIYKERRQSLRNNATPAEQFLWEYLRGKNFHGLKFRRQYSVGPFILDFYCPSLRLAIELDGADHEKEGQVRDRERDAFINKANIRVVRFWNEDVLDHTESVLQKLEHICCF